MFRGGFSLQAGMGHGASMRIWPVAIFPGFRVVGEVRMMSGNPWSPGVILRGIAVLLLVSLIGACGGGGGSAPRPPASSPGNGVDELAPSLADETEQDVQAAVGAVLELGGARLTVPAAALETDVRVGLREYSLPDEVLIDDATPAPSGQRVLWDRGFIPVVDHDVTLRDHLRLSLPVDPARLPPGAGADNIHVSVLVLGELVPQGWPARYDASTGRVEVELPYTALFEDMRHQLAVGRPQASNLALAVVTGLAIGLRWQPLMATVDDLSAPFVYESLGTDHFKLRYRAGKVREEDVRAVGDALEYAHGLFVEQMGFELPTDWDDEYTFYIDDFANHANFVWMGATEANGLSLPPSPFIEGAGYVNATKPAKGWPLTAVHEYFHALQYGELTTALPSTLYSRLMTDASWLLEGSAAALSARSIAGGTVPTRDASINLTVTQEMSLFDKDQGPPAEVAQDFFVFLERLLGSLDFYRATFRALDSFELGEVPNSVATLDEVLRAQAPPPLKGMSLAWRAFVLDRVLDNPDAYGVNLTPAHLVRLDGAGGSQRIEVSLPPLSYAVARLAVPRFRSDLSLPEQPGGLAINLREPTASGHLGVRLDARLGGQRLADYPQPILLIGGGAFVTTGTIRDNDSPVFVDVLLFNDALEGTPLRVSLDARLRNEAEGVGLAGYFFVDQQAQADSVARYGARILDLHSGDQWSVADASAPVQRITALGRDGEILLRGDSTVTLKDDWGRGQAVDLETLCGLQYQTNKGGMGDTGIAYVAGEQWHRYEHPQLGEVQRLRSGLFEATLAGCSFLEVDRNGDGLVDGGPDDDLSVRSLAVSRDGLRIFFVEDLAGSLSTVSATGGGYRRIIEEGIFRIRAVSADGSRLLVDDEDGRLLAVDSADGRVIDLDQRSGASFLSADGGYVDLRPDGERVAMVGWRQDTGQWGVLELSLDASWSRWRVEAGLQPSQLHYMADGRGLLVSATADDASWDLYLYEAGDGAGLRRLTRTPQVLEVVNATR